jgi:dephospho-CoA kinase
VSVGSHIIVVTGIQAAGKSTVARLLTQRIERGVHIEADVLYQMIVTGRVLPEEPGAMPPEAERQLRLRLRNACRSRGRSTRRDSASRSMT